MLTFLQSKWIKGILVALGIFIFMLISFSAGVAVGEHKARHFSRFPNHAVERRQPFPFPPMALPGTHGVFGEILSISGSTIIIESRGKVEQPILVTSSTEIRIGREHGTLQDLHTKINIAVFGTPTDQGPVEARLIRVLGR